MRGPYEKSKVIYALEKALHINGDNDSFEGDVSISVLESGNRKCWIHWQSGSDMSAFFNLVRYKVILEGEAKIPLGMERRFDVFTQEGIDY
jgi:hypothetical protein